MGDLCETLFTNISLDYREQQLTRIMVQTVIQGQLVTALVGEGGGGQLLPLLFLCGCKVSPVGTSCCNVSNHTQLATRTEAGCWSEVEPFSESLRVGCKIGTPWRAGDGERLACFCAYRKGKLELVGFFIEQVFPKAP